MWGSFTEAGARTPFTGDTEADSPYHEKGQVYTDSEAGLGHLYPSFPLDSKLSVRENRISKVNTLLKKVCDVLETSGFFSYSLLQCFLNSGQLAPAERGTGSGGTDISESTDCIRILKHSETFITMQMTPLHHVQV